MIIKDKEGSIITLAFVVLLLFLAVNLISKFTFLDLTYLLFMIICFIKYIYIQLH